MATPSSAPGGLRRRNMDQATWSAPHPYGRSGANSSGRRDMAADSVDSSKWLTHIDHAIRERSEELEQVRHDNANKFSFALMDRVKQVRARSSPAITPMKEHVEKVSSAFTSEGHSERPPLAYPAAGAGESTNSNGGSGVANSRTPYSWASNERKEHGQGERRHSSSVSRTRLFHTPGDDVKSHAARSSSGSHDTNGYGQRGKLVNGRWSEGRDGELEKYKMEGDALRAQVAELERRGQQHMQSLADERVTVHELRQQLHAAENDASKERQRMRESMERSQRRISELEAALQERRPSGDDELQAQLEVLHQELARKDEELERLEERTNHYEECISKYRMDMRSAGHGHDASVEYLQGELEAMSRRAAELEGEIAEKERTVILQQEEVEKLRSILSQHQRESGGGEVGSGTTSEAAEGQDVPHDAEVADLRHEVCSLRAELSERDLRLHELKEQVQELKEQKRLEVEEVRRALEEVTVELQRERQQWLQSVLEKEGRVVEIGRDASGQKEELEAQVRALEAKVEEKEEEVQDLTERLHDTETQLKKDAESYSKMLSKVEQEYKQQVNRLTGKMSVLGCRALERLRRVHSYEACIKKLVLAVMQMPTADTRGQQNTTPVQVLPHPPAVSAGAPQPADPLSLASALPPLPPVQPQAFSPPPLAPTLPLPAPQPAQPNADLVGTPPPLQPLPLVPPVAAPASGRQAAVLAGVKAMQEELQKMSHDNARLRWALARNWGCWLTSPLGTVFVAVAVAFLSQLYVMLNGSICRLDYYRSGAL